MHHSDDPERRVMAATCYLDASGTHDLAPHFVVAGLVMNRDQFLIFDCVWNDILTCHNIEPPLHMKEFGEHGKHGNLNYDDRIALFTDVAGIINAQKIVSIAGTLDQPKFNTIMTEEIRNVMGPYGMCFLLCAFINHKQAAVSLYHKEIAFILDTGDKHAGHVRIAHKEMMRQQKQLSINLNVGTLTFADDKIVSVLQAADVIAWGVRRKISGELIGKGFQPIKNIFNDAHLQYSWEEDWLQGIMLTFKDSFEISCP